MGRRLNIKQKARLHNEHHLVLTDARTGKVKQEAWAYNIILDQGFEQLINNCFGAAGHHTTTQHIFGGHTGVGWCGQTHVGGGSGSSSPEMTQMIAYLGRKSNAEHESNYNFEQLTAYNIRVAVWATDELENQNITEVGLGRASETSLDTHAMIEDNEGNPVVIEKGESDVLTVYSKVIITMAHNYPEQLKLIEGEPTYLANSEEGNWLLAAIEKHHGGRYNSISFKWSVGRSEDLPEGSDPPAKDIIHTQNVGHSETVEANGFQGENKKLVTFCNIAAADGNERINEIGLATTWPRAGTASGPKNLSVFRMTVPCPGIWEGFEIEEEFIDQGDGSQTEYETNWAPIVEDSEEIRVDGAALTKDADYTINYETGVINFTTAPGDGYDIEADYGVEFIPKDENHVLRLTATFEFACGNQEGGE